ncbi:MAG TPA: MASE1 domain-containing protein [Burkholderiales bacterium]|nr:MASE1 domain-containing protein [Burkholderiales bacterium]
MLAGRSLRDAAVFVPCYIALDWASYIHPLGPFNITPWNPQPALAIAWMMLASGMQIPVVFATIALADVLVRHTPGGYAITLASAAVLAAGYAAIAWALKTLLRDAGLHTARDLALFATVVVAGTGVVGAAFVALLEVSRMLQLGSFTDAWLRFWLGDAVGILVTAPLLLAAADDRRRPAFLALARRAEPWAQALVLAATLWIIFAGLGGDPAHHFYLLFLPLIWIAMRSGMNGAVVATGIVQLGVVLGIHQEARLDVPVLELQVLVSALTLTGLFLGVVVDERMRAETRLHESLRLAAAGEMAGAIAHEVNQPLTALTNYGRSAQMLLAGAEMADLEAIIVKMLHEADRAAEVVRRLRDFFRTGTTRLERVSVPDLVAAARRIGETAAAGRGIAIEASSGDALPELFIDRLQVELILRNLLANAVEALAMAPQRAGRIRVAAERHDAGHVRIVVADNGPGIPSEARESLFEPFVSGKPSGMGLGLAVSRAIAEAHGGSLAAAAAPHGEFHLVLPCVQ